MSATLEMLGSPLAQAIGWALVHLVWQGAVVAGILAAVLALLQRQSAHVRYVVSCLAMLVLLGLGAGTAYRAYDGGYGTGTVMTSDGGDAVRAAGEDAGSTSTPSLLARTRAWLPEIVLFWIVGVAALSVRLAGGWLRAQRLAKRNASPVEIELQRTVARLAEALGLRRGVAILHSAAVEVPTVLGWLRPVILLPMTLSGLSPQQIEMILTHELAHIRRHDFVVNLMQSVVETLLFYHPAAWWISARIRIEREHCCDDAAVRVGGNALQYARALTRLEELRGDAGQLVLAANGGSLIERIRRVAGIRGDGPSRWLAGAALLTVVVALLAAPSLPLLARDRQAAPPAPPAPPAPRAIATPPAPPAAPAIAQSRIDVDADANDDDMDDDDADDVNAGMPEPPEPPAPPAEPAEPAAPRARVMVAPKAHVRAPRPPRAANCPDSIDVHIPAFTMPDVHVPNVVIPDIHIEPMDIHIGQAAMADAMRRGADAKKIRAEIAAAMKPTKAYLDEMRGAGLTLNEQQAKQFYMMGISPRYVRSLRDAGLRNLTAQDVLRLHARGITAAFVKELQRMQR